MLLQRLVDYADQIGLPPLLYQQKPVRYLILLKNNGEFLQLIDCASEKNKQGIVMFVPEIKRSMNIRAYLFADHAAYVLGIPRKEEERERTPRMHQEFVALARRCVQVLQEQEVQSILAFLETLDIQALHLPDDFDPTARITFEVNGVLPINITSVRAYWANISAESVTKQTLECLVCGETRPVVKTLPIAIRGIPGGQTTGMSLISANKEVFESYGLEKSFIAPTCEFCGERFCNALNILLKDKETHFLVSSLAYIFWAREPLPFSLTSLLSQTSPDDVQQLFRAPWKGRPEAGRGDVQPFYAACLSARGPRVVVRDWIETTLDRVQQSLAHYFALQHILDTTGNARWFPLSQLANATIRRDSKEDVSPQVGEFLLHFALYGGTLPTFLLHQVVQRTRVEQDVSLVQAAFIKMILLSQPDISWVDGSQTITISLPYNERNTIMSELDPTCPDAPYLCGRLLAVLESVQFAALGDINSTIVDRYYGTASSAPASVFGRLIRGAQPHLSKLQRDKPGAFYRLDLQLQEVLSGFLDNQFPTTLDLLSQGRFALGYYHQRTADRRARQVASQNRATNNKTIEAELELVTGTTNEGNE